MDRSAESGLMFIKSPAIRRFIISGIFVMLVAGKAMAQARIEGEVSHRFLTAGWKSGGVHVFNAEGKSEWKVESPDEISDAWILPDGGMVQSFSRRKQGEAGVIRFDKDQQVVWEYYVEEGRDNHSSQPLPHGGFLLGESAKDGLWMVELDKHGKEMKRVKVGNSTKDHHHSFRQVRKTPEGTYLGTIMKENKTYEWDSDGNLIRTFPKGLFVAVRLPGGNTLVSAREEIVEYDPKGKENWTLSGEDLPFGMNFNCGVQRLPNGNTVVGTAWHGKHRDEAAPMVFEVTREKQVVWKVYSSEGNMGNIQILDSDGPPLR